MNFKNANGQAIAVLTLKDAPKMSSSERREVANWLIRRGRELIKDGDAFAPRFRARYFRT